MRTKSLALVAAFWGAAAACAQAQPRATQVGTLDCNVAAGITSQKAMVCTFTSIRGGKEVYTGTVRKFGLDIGATAGGKIIWSVFAPGRAVRGALAGDYAGGSAEATIGAGLGANVLIGGSNRSIALQPLSVSGQEGLNLAIGVADLHLRVARR